LCYGAIIFVLLAGWGFWFGQLLALAAPFGGERKQVSQLNCPGAAIGCNQKFVSHLDLPFLSICRVFLCVTY